MKKMYEILIKLKKDLKNFLCKIGIHNYEICLIENVTILLDKHIEICTWCKKTREVIRHK